MTRSTTLSRISKPSHICMSPLSVCNRALHCGIHYPVPKKHCGCCARNFEKSRAGDCTRNLDERSTWTANSRGNISVPFVLLTNTLGIVCTDRLTIGYKFKRKTVSNRIFLLAKESRTLFVSTNVETVFIFRAIIQCAHKCQN